jgi:hypothetical protein
MMGALVCLGCGRPAAPERSSDEIIKEMRELPALYLSERTQKRVIAPTNRGIFIDEEVREICYRALRCTNPECPHHRSQGEPYLFIFPQPGKFVTSEGTLGRDEDLEQAPEGAGCCPACAMKYDLEKISADEWGKLVSYVLPYELPESAARLKALEAEMMTVTRAKKLSNDKPKR